MSINDTRWGIKTFDEKYLVPVNPSDYPNEDDYIAAQIESFWEAHLRGEAVKAAERRQAYLHQQAAKMVETQQQLWRKQVIVALAKDRLCRYGFPDISVFPQLHCWCCPCHAEPLYELQHRSFRQRYFRISVITIFTIGIMAAILVAAIIF